MATTKTSVFLFIMAASEHPENKCMSGVGQDVQRLMFPQTLKAVWEYRESWMSYENKTLQATSVLYHILFGFGTSVHVTPL